MDVKSKLLIFFPNCQIGGTERVISLMSEFFNRDYELYLLTICQNEKKYNYFYKDFFVLDNSYLHKKGLLNKIIKYKNWIKETKNVINKIQPDIILPFGEIPNFIVMYLKIFNYINSKVIVNVRNSESVFLEKAQFGKIIKLSMKFMYDRADLVLTNSNGSKIDLIDNIGVKNKIEVVYNPVRKCKEEKKETKTKKRIINIGRLNTQKAQHYLIEAINKLRMDNGKWRIKGDFELVIIGKGEREKELKELVKKYKLEDKIRFLGWQDNPFYWLQNSDVFVLTSRWEGMPNVLIEAMACKCPVISFDCPSGPNEIIDKPGENGVLLEVGDVEGLSESIANVLNDEEYGEKLSKNAYKRALDFDVEKIYLGFKEKIEKVLISG